MHYTRRQFAKGALLAAASSPFLISSLLAQGAGNAVHTVVKGDTLGHLSRRYGVSVDEIQRSNNLKGDLIRIGQKLKIPPSGAGAGGAGAVGAGAERGGADMLTRVRAQNQNIAVRTANWEMIIVHHSAIKYGNASIYDRSHRQRGMRNGLAYHFVIGNGIDSGDGEIEIGPRWTQQLLGGHVRSYRINLSAIGICLVGNFEETHPTRRQLDAFTQLMDWLRGDVLKKSVRFAGHKDVERNLCPGKNFPLASMHARYG